MPFVVFDFYNTLFVFIFLFVLDFMPNNDIPISSYLIMMYLRFLFFSCLSFFLAFSFYFLFLNFFIQIFILPLSLYCCNKPWQQMPWGRTLRSHSVTERIQGRNSKQEPVVTSWCRAVKKHCLQTCSTYCFLRPRTPSTGVIPSSVG